MNCVTLSITFCPWWHDRTGTGLLVANGSLVVERAQEKRVRRGELSDNASVRKWVRRVLAAAALLLVAGIAVVAVRGRRPASTAAAYFAKMTCSGVFLSGRDPASVRSGELALDIPLTRLISVDVDRQQGVVTASVAGLVKRRALYRPGLGCTLDSEVSVEELKHQSGSPPAPPAAAEPWNEVGAESLVRDRLNAALDDAFTEPEPAHPRRTRAVVVVRDGALVAERYAPGFSREMRLQGWSMGKSLTNALVGILVRQGKLGLHAPAPVPEWSPAFGFFQAGQLLRLAGAKTAPGEKMQLTESKDGGWEYTTDSAGQSKMEICIVCFNLLVCHW
jgi:hypothetical protein